MFVFCFLEISVAYLCPSSWILFDTSCYRYVSSLRTWSAALSYCRSIGKSCSTIVRKQVENTKGKFHRMWHNHRSQQTADHYNMNLRSNLSIKTTMGQLKLAFVHMRSLLKGSGQRKRRYTQRNNHNVHIAGKNKLLAIVIDSPFAWSEVFAIQHTCLKT